MLNKEPDSKKRWCVFAEHRLSYGVVYRRWGVCRRGEYSLRCYPATSCPGEKLRLAHRLDEYNQFSCSKFMPTAAYQRLCAKYHKGDTE